MAGIAGELTRKAVHIGMGGFAFVLRYLTPFQAAAFAAVALVFNLVALHRVTRGTLLRDSERPRRFSLGIVLYPAVVLALILVFRDRMELAAAGVQLRAVVAMEGVMEERPKVAVAVRWVLTSLLAMLQP